MDKAVVVLSEEAAVDAVVVSSVDVVVSSVVVSGVSGAVVFSMSSALLHSVVKSVSSVTASVSAVVSGENGSDSPHSGYVPGNVVECAVLVCVVSAEEVWFRSGSVGMVVCGMLSAGKLSVLNDSSGASEGSVAAVVASVIVTGMFSVRSVLAAVLLTAVLLAGVACVCTVCAEVSAGASVLRMVSAGKVCTADAVGSVGSVTETVLCTVSDAGEVSGI